MCRQMNQLVCAAAAIANCALVILAKSICEMKMRGHWLMHTKHRRKKSNRLIRVNDSSDKRRVPRTKQATKVDEQKK